MTRDLIFLHFNEMSVQTISVLGNPLKMKTGLDYFIMNSPL